MNPYSSSPTKTQPAIFGIAQFLRFTIFGGHLTDIFIIFVKTTGWILLEKNANL